MAGYIKDHRKELDSEIWLMPPIYHRVWQYLKYKVNYEEVTVPSRDGSSIRIRPGQHLTSIRQIAKGVGYYEAKAWKEPNPKTVDSVLGWMETKGMIVIDRGCGGRGYTLITIQNWSFYQHDATVMGNSQNSVIGNSQEVEKNQSYQGFSEEKYVTGNSREPLQVTVDGYKEKELRIKDLKDLKDLNNTPTPYAGDHNHETMNLAEPEFKDSHPDPFIQVLDAYCELHKKLDIHVTGVEREIMGRMIAGGLQTPFIIRTMNKLHDSKRQRETENGGRFQKPTSFKYYEKGIWEAWENESAITAGVPTPGVAIGAAPVLGRDRKGSRFQSRREKTNDYLQQAMEEVVHEQAGRVEVVFPDQQCLPQFRG